MYRWIERKKTNLPFYICDHLNFHHFLLVWQSHCHLFAYNFRNSFKFNLNKKLNNFFFKHENYYNYNFNITSWYEVIFFSIWAPFDTNIWELAIGWSRSSFNIRANLITLNSFIFTLLKLTENSLGNVSELLSMWLITNSLIIVELCLWMP